MFKKVKMKTQSLQQQIISVIREEILNGNIKPGEQLPSERQLAESLGVSRTSLREALKLLESAEIITIRHGVGAFVNEIDYDTTFINIAKNIMINEKELKELLVIRRIIEPKAAALAARNATEDDLDRLKEFTSNIRNILTAGEPGCLIRYAKQQSKFHSLIAMATGNIFISEIVNELLDLFKNSRVKSLTVEGRASNSLQEHIEIMNAIIARDPKAAEIAMNKHLINYQKTAFGQTPEIL